MRWTALTGAVFVIVFVIAVLIFGTGAGRHPAEIARYYGDHGDRLRQIARLYVLGIGVALAWYYLPLFALLAWVFAISVALSRCRPEQLPIPL